MHFQEGFCERHDYFCLYRDTIRDTLGLGLVVIVSFRHKGLRSLYETGSQRGIRAAHVPKVRRILSVLDHASTPQDVAIPSFRVHQLKGDLLGTGRYV